jgi:hypothetical protein
LQTALSFRGDCMQSGNAADAILANKAMTLTRLAMMKNGSRCQSLISFEKHS